MIFILEGNFIQAPYNDVHKLTILYTGNKWIKKKKKKRKYVWLMLKI